MHSNTYTVAFDAFEDDFDDAFYADWLEDDNLAEQQWDFIDPETVRAELEHEAICEWLDDVDCEADYVM